MTGTKRTGNKGSIKIGSISLALSGIALATTVAPSVFAAGTKPLPIEKIGLDNSRQLVIQFASQPGAFPSVPNVLDLPGPNHRVVVDFVDATIDKAKIPSVDDMKAAMSKVLPVINGIRYSILPNAAKPTARIVLDLPEDLKITARVVKLEESSVTINLGEAVQNLVVPKKGAKANVASAANASVGSSSTPNPEVNTASQLSAPAPTAVAAESAVSALKEVAPVAQPASASTVNTTRFETVETVPVVPPTLSQTTVNADGESVALKPEQKLEDPKAPIAGTKNSASSSSGGWDWNTSSDNALVTKIAETKSIEQDVVKAPKELANPAAAVNGAPVKTVVETETVAVNTAPVKQVAVTEPIATVAPAEVSPAAVTNVVNESKTENTVVQAPAESPAEAPTPKAEMTEVQPTSSQVDAAVNGKNASAPVPEAETTTEAPKSAPSATGAALAVKLYNAAVRNHLSGKLAEAINDYKGALAANPSLAEAHSNLGLIYNQQHNYAGALGEFHKALAINPKDAITYNGIGAALRAEKDLLGAIRNWQTAVDLDPKLATAHYNLGTAFEIQKDYDRALEAYKDAVENDYRLGEAYYRMGLINQRKNRLEDAATQFKEALKVSPNSEYTEDAKKQLADMKIPKK